MGFIEALRHYYYKAFDFKGRASRSEFWFVVLYDCAISLFLFMGAIPEELSTLWACIHFVPAISLTTRRLHDTGRSGWWQVICWLAYPFLTVPFIFLTHLEVVYSVSAMVLIVFSFIMLFGYIMILFWCAIKGTKGRNRYGLAVYSTYRDCPHCAESISIYAQTCPYCLEDTPLTDAYVSGEKHCHYCAEKIKAEAVLCRHCHKAVKEPSTLQEKTTRDAKTTQSGDSETKEIVV